MFREWSGDGTIKLKRDVSNRIIAPERARRKESSLPSLVTLLAHSFPVADIEPELCPTGDVDDGCLLELGDKLQAWLQARKDEYDWALTQRLKHSPVAELPRHGSRILVTARTDSREV